MVLVSLCLVFGTLVQGWVTRGEVSEGLNYAGIVFYKLPVVP